MVDDKHPAPMAQVRQAEYRIELMGESAPAVIDSIDDFMKRDTVTAVKKTKSGEKEINARPLVIDLKPDPNGFTARLMLTERDSIKPDLLIALLSDMAGVEPPEARIHRTLLLGEDPEGSLRPLMEL